MNQELFLPFWRRHLKLIVVSVVGFFAIFIGVQVSDHYQTKSHKEASIKFDELIVASQMQKNEEIEALSDELIQRYRKTVYAPLSAFMMAKMAVQKEDLPQAEKYLRMAMKLDKGTVKPIATERLARLLSEQKQFDEALKLLDTKKVSEQYVALFEETKGDIYLAQNDKAHAREAYLAAAKVLPRGVTDNRLQLKLIELGAKEE